MSHWIFSFIKLVTGTFEVFGMLALGVGLLRITFWSYLKELILISFITSISQVILYDILHTPPGINEIVGIVFMVILSVFFLKVTCWYAILLSITGYISSILVLVIIFFTLNLIKSSLGIEDMILNPAIVSIDQIIICFVLVESGVLLHKKGYGFLFVTENINFEPKVRNITIFLLTSIILSLLVLEVTIYFALKENNHITLFVVLTTIAIHLLFASIYYCSLKQLNNLYKENKRSLFNIIKRGNH
ncbi:hypothetical protein [Priestia aryabhattai]